MAFVPKVNGEMDKIDSFIPGSCTEEKMLGLQIYEFLSPLVELLINAQQLNTETIQTKDAILTLCMSVFFLPLSLM